MARARKCDICDTYYDEYNARSRDKEPNTLFFIRKDVYGNNNTECAFDCCPTCMNEIFQYCKYHKKEGEPT